MSDRPLAVPSREDALAALHAARAKYAPHAHVVARAHRLPAYAPPPPDCRPVEGVPPSTCSAYEAAADWLPPAFVQNATCACKTTPDAPSANAVRRTLQRELAATDPAFVAACREKLAASKAGLLAELAYEEWVAVHFAPLAYVWHQKAYASGCCPCGPAPFVDWVAVCTIPIPFCHLVEEAIDWFGSCHCTPGQW